MLNTIQSSSKDGSLDLDDSMLVSPNSFSYYPWGYKKSQPSFVAIRQIIADSNIDDFDELFKFLYDNADEILPNKIGTVAVLINDHQYKANFRIDKEINAMSLINQIINNK